MRAVLPHKCGKMALIIFRSPTSVFIFLALIVDKTALGVFRAAPCVPEAGPAVAGLPAHRGAPPPQRPPPSCGTGDAVAREQAPGRGAPLWTPLCVCVPGHRHTPDLYTTPHYPYAADRQFHHSRRAGPASRRVAPG